MANESHAFGRQNNDSKVTKLHFSVCFAPFILRRSYIAHVDSMPAETEKLQETNQ